MGLYASSQKVLVSSNHPHHAAAWHTDRTYPGICGCTVYLHSFLNRVHPLDTNSHDGRVTVVVGRSH